MGEKATEPEAATATPADADSLPLSPLQRAVVLTAVYSDLFNYPLAEHELHRYLVLQSVDCDELAAAVDSLLGRHLERHGDLVCLTGRGDIVETRRRRNELAERRWATATRYARWLARVPFVRLVAVCGSQAAGNPEEKSDLDFFCVTAAGRLWFVQICAMALRHVAGLFSLRVCPNYFLTDDNLGLDTHDLFRAREVAQTVPLYGGEVYDAFLEANRWSTELLPNKHRHDDRRTRLADVEAGVLKRWGERLLGGRPGRMLDGCIYRLLLTYYPLRLRHLGWCREQFRRYYRRDRQLVMTGGYSGEVERQFRKAAADRLGAAAVAADLERLFPATAAGAPRSDPLYASLYHQSYGRQRD